MGGGNFKSTPKAVENSQMNSPPGDILKSEVVFIKENDFAKVAYKMNSVYCQ